VRLRLTSLYCTLFIFSGAVTLAISLWWSSSVSVSPGIPSPPGPAAGQPSLVQAEARIHQLEYQVAALSDHLHAAESHQQLAGSALALAVMAVISAALGWLVAGRILRPLRAMTAATRQISENDLHQRLAMAGPGDELKDLADTIDSLLARLQAAFDAQRQFVANASHELRSPLTEQRALLEVALGDPGTTAAALRSTCEEVLAANQEQEQLIESLLTLARSQRGLDHREPFDLADITRPLLDACRQQAQSAGLSRSAVPASQIERLLQPFQRLSLARTGTPSGSGLGLSIVAAIARAHGAAISARPGNEGGLDVEVTFTTPATAHDRSGGASQPALAPGD